MDDDEASQEGNVIYLGSTLKRFKEADRGKNIFVIMDDPSKEQTDSEEDNEDEADKVAAQKLSSSIREPIQ